MLSVIMLGVAFFVMLNVIMLNGVMVSVVAPLNMLLASVFFAFCSTLTITPM
jgi:hypothetical protein